MPEGIGTWDRVWDLVEPPSSAAHAVPFQPERVPILDFGPKGRLDFLSVVVYSSYPLIIQTERNQ